MQVGLHRAFSALQSMPVSLIEWRASGASSLQIFFRIELPYIWSTVVLVITQMIMWVLKVFDIVFTMTHGGPFGASEVLANRIYRTDFNLGDFNYGSAMAVILFIAIIPVLILNIRNLSREESIGNNGRELMKAGTASGTDAAASVSTLRGDAGNYMAAANIYAGGQLFGQSVI